MPEAPIPWNARNIILRRSARECQLTDSVEGMRRGLSNNAQGNDVIRRSAEGRKDSEDGKGHEEHGLFAKEIADLGEDGQEASRESVSRGSWIDETLGRSRLVSHQCMSRDMRLQPNL